MDFNLILIHLSLSILLFLLINWIGNHSIHAGYIRMSIAVKNDDAPAFNFIYRAFSPVAFIIITSSLLYKMQLDWVVKNIYLVVVYYFSFRLAFNLLTGRRKLMNWPRQLAYILTSTTVSYYVYSNLIIYQESLFPSPKEIGSAVWLAVAAYIYHTFNNIELSDIKTKKRKNNYIKSQYHTYNEKYHSIIEKTTKSKNQEALIYTILIVENFNRPKIYRIVENVLFYLKLSKTLGIMQVTTKKMITDYESVSLGAKKIVEDHHNAKKIIKNKGHQITSWNIRYNVIKLYNPDNDYIQEVSDLYLEIIDIFYLDIASEIEEEMNSLNN